MSPEREVVCRDTGALCSEREAKVDPDDCDVDAVGEVDTGVVDTGDDELAKVTVGSVGTGTGSLTSRGREAHHGHLTKTR